MADTLNPQLVQLAPGQLVSLAAGTVPQLAPGQQVIVPIGIGGGPDGVAILDGVAAVPWATRAGSVYTTTRDAFCTSLTINAGVTLITAGFRLFASTITNNGTIHNNGGAGGAGTAGAGGSAGTGAPAGFYSSSAGGGAEQNP